MYVNFVILASVCYPFYVCMLETVCLCSIVNSEFFAWVLFSQNFANAKFCEIKPFMKWQNYSVVYWSRISCPICEFPKSEICLSNLFAKISEFTVSIGSSVK